jgi:LacI family transcriptional regulator
LALEVVYSRRMAATRNDVARLAGVSAAVVSYVVNDGPRPVSAGTRKRVLEAIDHLGYRPDTVARQLRTGRSSVIGVVLPDVSLPHYGELTHVLSELASERSRQLIVASTDWDLAREREQLEFLAGRRVDGVVLMSVRPTQDFQWLVDLGTRVVVIDRPEAAVNGARVATRHLLEHGHRRIAFVGGALGIAAGQRRREGWSSALAEQGVEVDDSMVVAPAMSREGGYAAAQDLLRRPTPPTAVYADSDAQAVGILRAAADLGVRVPDDLAVVTGEGTATARYAVPSLTSIEIPRKAIAEEALDALAGDEDWNPRSNTLRWVTNSTFELVIRESCGTHEV